MNHTVALVIISNNYVAMTVVCIKMVLLADVGDVVMADRNIASLHEVKWHIDNPR